MAQLDVAEDRLVKMRSHLKRALVALRDRLVAIYETGTPDVLSVIVGANGYDDLDRPRRIPRPHPRQRRSDRRPGARTARPGQAHGRSPARRQGPDRSGARLDRRRRAGPGKRPQCGPAAPGSLVAARGDRVAALEKIRSARRGAGRLGGNDPGEDRRAARRLPARCRCRPARFSGGSGGADLAGRRPGRLGLRPAHDQRQLRVPPGHRHRRAKRHADPRRGRRHRDLHRAGGEQRRLRQLHLHRPRRRALHLLRPPGDLRGLAPGSTSRRARSSATATAPATASARTFTSRSASTAKSPIRWPTFRRCGSHGSVYSEFPRKFNYLVCRRGSTLQLWVRASQEARG